MIWSPYLERWAPDGAAAQAYRRLWLLLLTLSITGGVAWRWASAAAGSQTGAAAALPATSGWPWLAGYRGDERHFPAGGHDPYRLLLATLPLRVLRRDVVASGRWHLDPGG